MKNKGCGNRIENTYLRLVCGVDGLCEECELKSKELKGGLEE